MDHLPSFMTEESARPACTFTGRRFRTPVLEKGVQHLARVIRESYVQWESSRREGILQTVDPRVKLLLLAAFLVLVSVKSRIVPQASIAGLILLLFLASRLDLFALYRRILWVTCLFGVIVPLPSIFNIFDGHEPLVPLLHLRQDHRFWLYHIPQTIGITSEGLTAMALLSLRIANSVALSLLIIYTTSFPDLIRALRVFRVPESFVAVITLSYKYVFIFARTLEEMHMAKKSRLLRRLGRRQSYHWAAGRIAFLFQKSQSRCEEICKAMVARSSEYRLPRRSFNRLQPTDWTVVALALAILLLFWRW
ncbi:MAG: cobalt ECF transporter T component CbiQ [Desulfobulbaceae bacterium]